MKNFLHVYRFGEELAKEGFNVVYPIKVTDTNWLSMLGISGPEELSIKDVKSYHFQNWHTYYGRFINTISFFNFNNFVG